MMTCQELAQCDQKADSAIKVMVASVVGGAVIPAVVNFWLAVTAMGVGCTAIGCAYGKKITKEEGWMLVRQFFLGAGMFFCAVNIGTKIIAGLLQAATPLTAGASYGAGVVLDALVTGASAYAVGGCAKAYFRKMIQGQSLSKDEARELFRRRFKEYKEVHKDDKLQESNMNKVVV